MSLLTFDSTSKSIPQSNEVLSQLAQNELGLTMRKKIQTNLEKALLDPTNYVKSKQKELNGINASVGTTFAKNFKDYVNKGLPEKLAKHMAMRIARGEQENKERMLNLEYPDLIGQYALAQAGRRTFTNLGSIDIMNAGARISSSSGKKRTHKKKSGKKESK